MSDLLTTVGRGHLLFRAVWVSVFATLGLYIVIRMIAQGADAFGLILIAGVDALVWWRAWSFFQRFRAAARPE